MERQGLGVLTVVSFPPVKGTSSEGVIEDVSENEPEGVLSYDLLVSF